MEAADDLRRSVRERRERASAHLDALVNLLCGESLVIQDLYDGGVGGCLMEMTAPADARLVRRRMPCERVGQHHREEPVLVPTRDDAFGGEAKDDRRAAAAPSVFRLRPQEPG